jgi:hypothetical protein
VAALYYIIQNGVRWTGMPAWKAEHSPEDTWRLVTFIRKTPTLTDGDMVQVTRRGGSEARPPAGWRGIPRSGRRPGRAQKGSSRMIVSMAVRSFPAAMMMPPSRGIFRPDTRKLPAAYYLFRNATCAFM